MSRNFAILFTLFVISLVASISIAKCQFPDSNLIAISYENPQSNLIALSDDKLTFVGDETTTRLDRDLIIVGLEDNVQVNFFSEKLYDASSRNALSIGTITPFTVSKNEPHTVNIAVDTSGAAAETYNGSIIITAATTDNSTTTHIDVTVIIEGLPPPLGSQMFILATVVLFCAIAFILALLNKPPISVIVLSSLALIFWFYAIITGVFKEEIIEIVGTVLIVPFAAFVIDHVKKKRDERTERIKISREVLGKASKEDIDWLRNVIGETTTHFAGFNPKFEGVPEVPETPEILYHKNGVLTKKYWDENYKQGAASDLPTLNLAKYYDYIDLYNSYYKAAMMLTKGKTAKDFQKMKNKPFLKKFEKFRESFAALETVLFVYMSYFMGLFAQKSLSPLKVEYPRITRTLLYKLLEYEILEPSRYLRYGIFDPRRYLHDSTLALRFAKASFEEDKKRDIAKRNDELISEYKGEERRQKKELQKWFNVEFQKWEDVKWEDFVEMGINVEKWEDVIEAFEKWEDVIEALKGKFKGKISKDRLEHLEKYKEQFDKWKKKSENKDSVKEDRAWALRRLLKRKIENWKLTARESDKILKDIYQKDDIPRFYREAGVDFADAFKDLLKSIKELEPLPPEFVAKEKTPEILEQHKIHKELLDDLERLKKLLTAKIITPKQFDSTTKETLENLNALSKHSQKTVLIEELKQLEVLRQLNVISQADFRKERRKIVAKISKIKIP